MSKKILVVQPDLRAYRVSFFMELYNNYKFFQLLHYGKKTFNKDFEMLKKPRIKEIAGFKWIFNFSKLIDNNDIIIVPFDIHWLNFFLLSNKSLEKIIFWGHGLGKSKIANKLKLIVGRKVGAIVTYSELGRETLIKNGLSKEQVFVAHNTIHIPNHELTDCGKDGYFLYVGRLQFRKRLDIFITALSNHRDVFGDVKLVIVGDGEVERKRLEQFAKDLNVFNNVIFKPGTINNDELKTIYMNAKCYVSPGHVGLGVLHSFSYGVPVICIRNDYHAPEVENIDGTNGFICDSIEDFEQKLLELEKTGYNDLAKNAYSHYVEKRTNSNMVSGFISAINYVKTKED